MHAALAVEELGMIIEGDDRAVPDVRVDIKTTLAGTIERDEIPRRHRITRQRQGHEEALAIEGVEQLPAIWMIVRAPDECALTPTMRLGGQLFRPTAPAEKIAVTDRIVGGVQRAGFPPEFEQTLGDAALIASVLIDRP